MILIKKQEIQSYLCLPLPKNLVSYLSKLRISAHQLYVETCRYCNPSIPREIDFFSIAKILLNMKNIFYLIVLCINMSEKSIQNYLILIS